MGKKSGMVWAALALAIFVLGGLLTFAGLALIMFMKGRDLFGLGEGRSFGILLFCLGLGGSILGVLLMRLVRNGVQRAG